jgi:hypothetical protein
MTHTFIMCQKEHLTRSSCENSFGRFCLTFLFILVTSSLLRVSAQEAAPILFHGLVLDAETHQPLTGAHYMIRGKTAGAADERGMVSFYARHRDTVRFSCVGYKDFHMVIGDTLVAKEYIAGIYLSSDTLMIPAVVVMPRLVNMRSEIMAEKPGVDNATINATNNLKISTYQGLTAATRLDDPAANYDVIRHMQAKDAGEKGGIPSDQMVAFNPFVIIPIVYILAKGLPEDPPAPAPHISAKELNRLTALHDSLIYKTPRP